MINLKIKMWLLVALMFAILYGIIIGLGAWLGIGDTFTYIFLAVLFTIIQYLIGPYLVSWMMRVRWVTEKEEPELCRMIEELAIEARIPRPKVGISEVPIPNAFAFGRSARDGRVCVTTALRQILNEDELKAVLGHEISHLKHRDMIVITLLSVIPMILYWIARSAMWGGRDRGERGSAVLIGLIALLLYFIANLLVLWGSRIREYYADRGSCKLGNQPQYLASALYKLVYSSARLQRNPFAAAEIKQVEGARTFFLNDITGAQREIQDLKVLDRNLSGTIDLAELVNLKQKTIKLSFGEQFIELFSSHPNMLRRIKYLSSLI